MRGRGLAAAPRGVTKACTFACSRRMDSRFRRFLTAVAWFWLLPLSLASLPLLAMGEPPPRPSEIPLEVPVADLGQNDRLPQPLRSRY